MNYLTGFYEIFSEQQLATNKNDITFNLNKGSLVFLEGRLNYQTWKLYNGQKRRNLEVVDNNVHFLISKQTTSNGGT